MKACVLTDYYCHTLQNVPIPARRLPDDVLVRVRSAGICGSDLHGYTGQSGRRVPPLIMGHEATGDVVELGAETPLQVGQRVALQPLIYRPDPATGIVRRRLIGMDLQGAYAEYIVMPAENLFPIPDTLSYAEGALAEPLAVAVHAVSLSPIRPYDRVLVIGAGAIGLLTVQVLRLAGAGLIVVSDINETRLNVAKQIGAHEVIRADQEDVTRKALQLTDGRGFDRTYEAVGITQTVQQSVASVCQGGTVVWIGNNQRTVEVDMQSVVTREITIRGTYGMTQQDFHRALAILADGAIRVTPLINRRATLDECPTLFDELIADQTIIKCIIEMDETHAQN